MKPLYRKALITIAIYVGLILLSALLGTLSPGGPCVPGGGLLFLLFICPIVVFILFCRDAICAAEGKKDFYLSLAINSLMLICMVIAYKMA